MHANENGLSYNKQIVYLNIITSVKQASNSLVSVIHSFVVHQQDYCT